MHPNKAYDEVMDFIALSRLLNVISHEWRQTSQVR